MHLAFPGLSTYTLLEWLALHYIWEPTTISSSRFSKRLSSIRCFSCIIAFENVLNFLGLIPHTDVTSQRKRMSLLLSILSELGPLWNYQIQFYIETNTLCYQMCSLGSQVQGRRLLRPYMKIQGVPGTQRVSP